MKGQIFISYRRQDSIGSTGRLYDRLIDHFTPDKIFMDIDTIPLGEDFLKVIEQAINESDILLVVIGRHWLNFADKQGARLLDNPEDFVRIEIRTALAQNIKIVPVLVENATMPSAKDLPDDLKALSTRNAVEISYTRFNFDTEKLIVFLKKIIDEAAIQAKLKVENEKRQKEATELRNKEEQLWKNAEAKNIEFYYRQYIKEYPRGIFVAEANKRIRDLFYEEQRVRSIQSKNTNGADKQDTKIKRMTKFQIVITILILSSCIASIPFARLSYFESDDRNDVIIHGFLLIISIMLIIVSLTISFITFTNKKIWTLTVVAISLLVFQVKAPTLAVKYGWGGVRNEYMEESYNELLGSIIRAESRFEEGRWGDALEIFSLLKKRMPQGHPDIFEMKVLLFRAGYYKGPVDNIYSDEILIALNSLKSYYNLPINDRVENSSNTKRLVYNTQTVLFALAFHELLGLNIQVKPSIVEIQTAIKNFQKNNDLHIDGDIGDVTLRKLSDKFNIKAGL
jgi:hypothetical protein